jgi:hypothetical protein
MKSIKRQFRNSYLGEDIYSSASYKDGSWGYDKEYVPRTLNFQGFGKTAAIIGNGISRLDFNLAELKKNNVKKAIQTYGCNALYRDFDPDFLVCTRSEVVREVAQSGYCANNVVYATGSAVLSYPGSFHLIPQDPGWNAGSIATYLACFDGYQKVILIGFDGNDTPNSVNNVYVNSNGYLDQIDQKDNFMALTMSHVFKTYPLVDFVLVNSTGRGYMPHEWYGHTNLRRINFRDLVLECDL